MSYEDREEIFVEVDLPDEQTWSGTGSETELELQLALQEFCDLQTPLSAILLLQVLYDIHRRIKDKPMVDKYYRIYVKGDIFERHVWILEGSRKFMQFCGWVKCGNYIILSKGYPIKHSVHVIEDFLRKKKKAQVLSSGSVQTHHKRPDISIRRTHSAVGGSTIEEDEILETYTNIEAPIETDSAIGSGLEDEDEVDVNSQKPRLRRLESKEHVVGNEQYIVVDFIGNVEVSSRKSSNPVSFEGTLDASPRSTTSAFEEIYGDDEPIPVNDSLPEDIEQNRPKTEVKDVIAPVEFSEKQQKKNFSAGRGLKQAKKENELKLLQKEDETKADEKEFDSSSNESTSSKGSLPNETAKDIQRTTSNRDVTRRSLRDSSRLEKTLSQRSFDNDQPVSIVMQNKLLFDQQIAEGLKKKYPSAQNLNRRRDSSNLDLSNFEKPKVQYSGSFNEKRNAYGGDDDVNLSGIFAASRSMFEQGQPGKSKNRVTSLPKRDNTENKTNEESSEHVDENKTSEINKPRTDSTLSTESETSNPLLSNYKEKGIKSSSKKKKFPFKKRKGEHGESTKVKDKKKLDKSNSVELLAVKSTDDTFEERAIDVPSNAIKEEVDESGEKKKKGLFSRMRRHRKSSSDSDHEVRHEKKQRHPSTDHQEKMEENYNQGITNINEEKELNENVSSLPNSDDLSVRDSVDISADVSNISLEADILQPELETPPSNSYSSEISSVLENIIDRKTSITSADNEIAGKGRKKKFFKKKKRSSNVDKHSEIIETNLSHEKEIEANISIDEHSKIIETDLSETFETKLSQEKAIEANISVEEHPSNKNSVSSEVSMDTQTIHSEASVNPLNNEYTPEAVIVEEQVREVIRTNKLVSDWSIDIEDMLEEEHRVDDGHVEMIMEEEEGVSSTLKEELVQKTEDVSLVSREKPIQNIDELSKEEPVQNIDELSKEKPVQNIDELSKEKPIQIIDELSKEKPVQNIDELSKEEPVKADIEVATKTLNGVISINEKDESVTQSNHPSTPSINIDCTNLSIDTKDTTTENDDKIENTTTENDIKTDTNSIRSESDSNYYTDTDAKVSGISSIRQNEEGDDVLADLLEEANNRDNNPVTPGTASEADSISFDEHSISESITDDKGKKKKKRFKFPLGKSKKDKQKKNLNVSLPEGLNETPIYNETSDKSSRKFKRPKSLEILADVFPRKSKSSPQSRPESLTQEDIERLKVEGNSSFETEEKGKKKKLSFFKKKKKSENDSPVKSMSYVSYTDPNAKDHIDKNDVKHVMVSSDEFTIPESNVEKDIVTNGHSTNDVERKYSVGPDHREFIKNDEILEVKQSDSMHF